MPTTITLTFWTASNPADVAMILMDRRPLATIGVAAKDTIGSDELGTDIFNSKLVSSAKTAL